VSLKFAVLISGGGTNLQALIDAVESGVIPAEIALVVSDREGAYGLERAKKHNIPSTVLARKAFGSAVARDAELIKMLEEHNVDFVMLAGYLSILTEELIKKYEKRIINIHPALIPNYAGKGFYGDVIHEAVLKNGDKETGVTLHFVDTGVDSGPIIVQERIAVMDDDTLDSLKSRIHKAEHRLIVDTAKKYCEGGLQK
jgi:phosphoribosylglycinamide formyltransferase-1